MDEHEATQFQRMETIAQIDRAREMIVQYEAGIAFFRKHIDYRLELLGHIAGRLGESEPVEGGA